MINNFEDLLDDVAVSDATELDTLVQTGSGNLVTITPFDRGVTVVGSDSDPDNKPYIMLFYPFSGWELSRSIYTVMKESENGIGR